MNKSRHIKKDSILKALEKSLGVVNNACRIANVPRSTFYKWMKEDQEFAKEVEDIANVALDFAESQLYKQIADNSTAATIFYLKTKGKHRGYIEKTEHDIKIHQEQPLYPPLTEDGVVLKSLLNDN
tara:strand:- start:31 stop:408 length:378 start_codon:yes stop_codon:yes gene_type:complete